MDYKVNKNPNNFFRKLSIVNERMIVRDKNGKEHIKALEAEDRIALKTYNDLELRYNYKLSSYADKIYNDFLKIQKECKNIKKVEELQSYVDYVIKMKKAILNKLHNGQYSIEDRNLITYIDKWLEIQKKKGINIPNIEIKLKNIDIHTRIKNKPKNTNASDLTSYHTPKNSETFYTIVDSKLISEENEKNVKTLQDEIVGIRRKKLETKLKDQKEKTESSLKSFENYVKGFIGELEKVKADKDQKYNQILKERDTEINNVIEDSIKLMKKLRQKLGFDTEPELDDPDPNINSLDNETFSIIEKLEEAKKVDLYKKDEKLPQEQDFKTNLELLCKVCDKKYKKISNLSLTNGRDLEMIKKHCEKYKSDKKHFSRFLEVCESINTVRQKLLSARCKLRLAECDISKFTIDYFKSRVNKIPNNLGVEKNDGYVLDNVIDNISDIEQGLYNINGEVEEIYKKYSESQEFSLMDDVNKLRSNIYDYKKDLKEINEFKNLDVENAIKIFTTFKELCKNPSEFYNIHEVKTNFKIISNFVKKDEFYSDINLDNNIISKFKIDLDSKLAKGRNNEGKWEEYKDLPYKARKEIIDQWIPSLNKIIELKSKSKNELDKIKLENYKLFLTYLKIVDNYFAQNQNESEDGRYNQVGFNTIKDINGKELKNFKVEKKMWNVKRQGKTNDTTQSYIKPYFSVNDVKQGSIGDCWLESTLKSMALKSPDKLLEVFPNYLQEINPEDGSLKKSEITVRLYDYDYNNYSYTPKNYKDILVNATELATDENKPAWNEGKVLWPHIIEKAIDKFIEEFEYDKTNNYGEQIRSGNGAYASVMLIGKPTKINMINSDKAKVLEQLKDALKNSDAPTCGTKPDFGVKNGDELEKEKRLDDPNAKEVRFLFSNHGYTLKHVHDEDKSDISKTKIDLINPWGVEKIDEPKIEDRSEYNEDRYYHYENAVGKNKITISLGEFINYFDHICY